MIRVDHRILGMARMWVAALLLGGLADPASALLADVTAPPPAGQFREGDHWRSWGFDAAGNPTNSFRFFGVRNGAWYELPNDMDNYSGARDARSFEQLKEPVFYPTAPYDGQIVATVDGLLHRNVDGRWVDLPLNSTLTDKRGTVYRIDVRATPHDADQLSEIFQHTALSEQPLGEKTASPILLPTLDQVAAAPARPPEQKPDQTPIVAPPKPPEASPSSGLSLKMAALYLLFGAVGALVLVKLLGRKPTPPSP